MYFTSHGNNKQCKPTPAQRGAGRLPDATARTGTGSLLRRQPRPLTAKAHSACLRCGSCTAACTARLHRTRCAAAKPRCTAGRHASCSIAPVRATGAILTLSSSCCGWQTDKGGCRATQYGLVSGDGAACPPTTQDSGSLFQPAQRSSPLAREAELCAPRRPPCRQNLLQHSKSCARLLRRRAVVQLTPSAAANSDSLGWPLRRQCHNSSVASFISMDTGMQDAERGGGPRGPGVLLGGQTSFQLDAVTVSSQAPKARAPGRACP